MVVQRDDWSWSSSVYSFRTGPQFCGAELVIWISSFGAFVRYKALQTFVAAIAFGGRQLPGLQELGLKGLL